MEDDARIFSLAGQNLKLNTREEIQPHLDRLDAISDLQEIHLGGNTFGVEACQALADVLKRKSSLKIADFADIFTGRLISEIPDALRALCDALIDNTNLVELNLSDNAFGGRSAEPMVNFLKNNHSFSVLKLNNNGLGITGGTIVAQALLEAAEIIKSKGLKSNLRTVICGRNRLENGSAPYWAKAYAAHGGLVEVRMFQNGIRMEGIEAISRGLAQCPNLEVFDVQDNTATIRGSRAIAACMPSWPKLRTLNLSDCLLKPKGGALVIEALRSTPKLKTLHVEYCDLDRKALAQLGAMIKANLSELDQLEINGNWADEEDECIEQIKAALAAHGHEDALEDLDELDPDGGEDDEDEEDDGEEEKGSDDDDGEVSRSVPVAGGQGDETDDLADALSKTTIGGQQQEKRGIVAATSTEAVEKLTETRQLPKLTVAVHNGQSEMTQPDYDALPDFARYGDDDTEAVYTPSGRSFGNEQVEMREALAATPTPVHEHEPVNLSNELHVEPQTAGPTQPKKKKRGLRAAWGAVRTLLK